MDAVRENAVLQDAGTSEQASRATPMGQNGGSGAIPCRSQQIADAKLAGRAIRERWPIPEPTRLQLITDMAAIAHDSEDDRASVGAGKVLVEMDKLNQADEHKAQGDGAPGSVTFEQISRMRVAR